MINPYNLNNLKQEIKEAVSKTLIWEEQDPSICTISQVLLDTCVQELTSKPIEGLAYLCNIKPHKVKRGYAPRYIKCRSLYGRYHYTLDTVQTEKGSTLVVRHYITPFAKVEPIKINGG